MLLENVYHVRDLDMSIIIRFMGYVIHLIVVIIYNLHVLIVYLGMKLEKNFQDLVWLHFVEIGKMMELVRCVYNLIH